ncbi:ABC transporter permease, partial [bacterium]|nr:ABC transporter permease [bacterium]
MLPWLARRLAYSLLLLFVLASAVFFAVRLAPGDPLDQVVNEEVTAADRALLRQRLGLDRSLPEQYAHWLTGAVRGDFGLSLRQQRPVADVVGDALGPTLQLTLVSYVLHLALAVATALALAARRRRAGAAWLEGTGLVFYSVPAFWLGLMFILLFSRQLGWFPAGGFAGPDAAFLPAGARLVDRLRHLALPVLTLTLSTFMGTTRYLQAALEEVLAEDYILAARARGLPEDRILRRHALRNALLPLITLVGLSLPWLVGGALVVETVFGWPGLGRVTIEAVWARDYTVIMATTVLAGAAVVAGSTLADLLYRRADPRVRAAGPDGGLRGATCRHGEGAAPPRSARPDPGRGADGGLGRGRGGGAPARAR